jgi:hypothetical protein
MWERAARHNPLSLTNYYYLDHRPFLPQDPTFNHLWRKQYTNYAQILIKLKVKGGQRILFLNNLQAADRERIKVLLSQHGDLEKCIGPIAFAISALLTGSIMKSLNKLIKYKAMGLVAFGLNFWSVKYWLNRHLDSYNNTNLFYYFQKYEHLTVDNVSKITDPRRQYFQVDTTSYYRETADEILHHGHDSEHHDHDTATYYGPYPVIFFNFSMMIILTLMMLRRLKERSRLVFLSMMILKLKDFSMILLILRELSERFLLLRNIEIYRMLKLNNI